MTWLYFELGLLHAFLVFLGASLCIEMKIAIRSPDFPPLNSRPVPIANGFSLKIIVLSLVFLSQGEKIKRKIKFKICSVWNCHVGCIDQENLS